MKKIDCFQGEYRFLSNFWPSPIEYNGIKYSTVEHAYQASKAYDDQDRLLISYLLTPGEAKRFGKRVLLRQDWEHIKDQIMEDCVRLKFSIPELKYMLLATGDAELIEGNTWNDTYWGRCNGIGKNKLEQILMKIRNEIQEEICKN
jgi:ribA/ribD-fused uncharacterized protein